MSVIGVVATLKIQDGKQVEFEKIFADLRDKVNAHEEGNLMYEFFRSRSDPQTYIVMEQYRDQAALEAHGKSEHFKAAGPALGGVLGGAPVIEYLEKV